MITRLSSESIDGVGRGYPRPQLRRDGWMSLNGDWDFAIDRDGTLNGPDDVQWSAYIAVPYAPEAPASGVANTSFYKACWYRRSTTLPPIESFHRRLLHFGAVDYRATIWVNGLLCGEHEGGYTPFTVDITSLATDRECEVVLLAEDDPHDLAKPRGKQDWQHEPHAIWYPRTTGIWQTVWIEDVPDTWIQRIAFTPDLARWEVGLEVWIGGEIRDGLHLHATLAVGQNVLAADRYLIVSGEVHRRIALSDPGIDDSRNELLWSPEVPTLIDVRLTLSDELRNHADNVRSYAALRGVSTEGDRFLLNGRPYPLRLVLDQGYWPEGGLTSPGDEALRRDVALVKEMGFNGVRKHQKLEDPRYLFWCDQLGLLMWGEMPSAYRFTRDAVERLAREWTAAIARDYSHPCVVAWVPINESWGVPNLPDNPRERHYVQALYHLTKTLDPTRPVIGNDGWESVATDIIGIHDYDDCPDRLARRYHADELLPRLYKRERPGGRMLFLGGEPPADLPLMLTEFGGIALAGANDGGWGYSVASTPEELADQYTRLLAVVSNLRLLSGFCYTQFTDTYQEANGLLHADRSPKIPLRLIAAATAGRGVSRLEDRPRVEEGKRLMIDDAQARPPQA